MKLIDSYPTSGTYFYTGTDTEQLYNYNLKKQPVTWVWRNRKIEYTVNSQGYRAPEWDQCDWNNSILILGDSVVYGEGICNNQTMVYYLASISNVPVINLGISSTSTTIQWLNTVLLLEQNVNALCVIYVWPTPLRICSIINDHSVYNYAPFDNLELTNSWLKNENNIENNLNFQIDSVNHMWANKNISCYHYSLRQLPNCKVLSVYDRGRDIQESGACHPGPRSNRMWAREIYQDIKNII